MGKNKTVVITGGGTGGHVYPGIALAEALKKQYPDIQVHFVGAEGGLEEKIVPQHGYPLHLLRVGRLHHSVSPTRRLKALFLLPLSFVQSFLLYLKLRPLWVLGIGGFASGPFVFTASVLGGHTAILEPNAHPGMANRWLSKLVRHCFVVFKEAGRFFPAKKVQVVGLPVRLTKQEGKLHFDGSNKMRILVFGGSQGARFVNQKFTDWVETLNANENRFEIVHQIGNRDFAQWKERYQNKYDSFLQYFEYLHDMPERLQWADLVICRSGIGSVAEVAMASRPAIFIPLPTAADNHQVKNAEVLSKQNAALMIEQKDLTKEKFHEIIERLYNHPDQLRSMVDQLKSVDYSRAPDEILGQLMKGLAL